jgi:carbamoyltransferase
LAPYGQPKYAGLILEHLIDLKDDGSFRLDLDYFDYCTGLTMTNARFNELFGGKPRSPNEPLDQRHMDLAASVQQVTEEIVLRLTRSLAREGRSKHLCLAGGVALNCVANGKVLRDGMFKDVWIQPAAGDAGAAVGAAMSAYYQFCGKQRPALEGDAMNGGYLGPSFTQAEIEQRLEKVGAVFSTLTEDALLKSTIEALVTEKAVGWFQGQMEFGPRALGARSILGDPRSHAMQSSLNLRVKFRESFRPFAPAVLREDVGDWFELDRDSPYMQIVADVLPKRRLPAPPDDDRLFGIERLNIARSEIPAVTHVDFSARIQTVHKNTNERFHALLTAFKAKTGCPVLVNTSFNIRGEPIVCTPEDAFRCFMGSDIEVLAIGNCFLNKGDQPSSLKIEYRHELELD